MPTDDDIKRFTDARKAGKLSTKHKKLISTVAMTPEETVEDLLLSISPESRKELEEDIARTKNPKIKAILLQEQERLAQILQQVMPVASAQASESTDKNKTNQDPMQSLPTMMDKIGSMMSKLWSSQ